MLLLCTVLLCVSLHTHPINGGPPSRCDATPSANDLEPYLVNSPIVAHARLQEIVPLGERLRQAQGFEFDLVAHITKIINKPPSLQVPTRIVVRRFFIPPPNTTDPYWRQRFGCLEFFQPNAKFTFMIAETAESVFHAGSSLPVFALTGPLIPYDSKLNVKIFESLCKSCDAPKVNSFQTQTVPFGGNFNTTCIAEGNPLPDVMWFKGAYPVDLVFNGRGLRVDIIQLSNSIRHAILEIENLILLDNGDYTCKASNVLGIAQSVLKLRVTTAGVPPSKQEDAMDSRDFEPCPPAENHCFNGGECYVRKTDPLVRKCNCKEAFMGDQCQFRTSGIVVIIIFIFRCKDQRLRRNRKIMRILEGRNSDVLCKSQYVQVNTIDPPPPPIKNTRFLSRQSQHQQTPSLAPLLPQTPHYARLPNNVFDFNLGPPASPSVGNKTFRDDSLTRPRITSLQQPQHLGLQVGTLDPIEEHESIGEFDQQPPPSRQTQYL
ncbi:unnamed protein product [Mesocestoides corti]|uniref:Ig-like domain-containing protein n=1 Tax=Mesocestoides corti TaxID=53468 RepID=A0A0R3UAD0_MESCO|nr:unnamed protein product [Mesocestoides corti]